VCFVFIFVSFFSILIRIFLKKIIIDIPNIVKFKRFLIASTNGSLYVARYILIVPHIWWIKQNTWEEAVIRVCVRESASKFALFKFIISLNYLPNCSVNVNLTYCFINRDMVYQSTQLAIIYNLFNKQLSILITCFAFLIFSLKLHIN